MLCIVGPWSGCKNDRDSKCRQREEVSFGSEAIEPRACPDLVPQPSRGKMKRWYVWWHSFVCHCDWWRYIVGSKSGKRKNWRGWKRDCQLWSIIGTLLMWVHGTACIPDKCWSTITQWWIIEWVELTLYRTSPACPCCLVVSAFVFSSHGSSTFYRSPYRICVLSANAAKPRLSERDWSGSRGIIYHLPYFCSIALNRGWPAHTSIHNHYISIIKLCRSSSVDLQVPGPWGEECRLVEATWEVGHPLSKSIA